jgi:phospholipid/cholesterol/gamma-HCH transport system substrate-binding protein
VLAALVLMGVFAWTMGTFNPLRRAKNYSVYFGFAGGIQTGSPVRISGTTVGKVEAIRFHPEKVDAEGQPTPVEVVVSVNNSAREAVRQDSQFFINVAGLIGEKYIEVTPGAPASQLSEPGSEFRGEDPPRFDQLLSQSFGLAGELRKLFNEKKSSINNTIELMLKLTENLNRLFESVGSQKNITSKKLDELFNNLVEISSDLHTVTSKIRPSPILRGACIKFSSPSRPPVFES